MEEPSINNYTTNEEIKISMIFPIISYTDRIRQIIESCIFQNFTEFEIMILDMSGDSKVMEILNDYIHYNNIKIFNEDSSGFSSAGIYDFINEYCKGEALYFINGEDVLGYNLLGRMYEYIEDCDVVIGLYKAFFENKLYTVKLNNKYAGKEVEKKHLIEKGYYYNPRLIRKSFFIQGAYNKDFKKIDDYLLWLNGLSNNFAKTIYRNDAFIYGNLIEENRLLNSFSPFLIDELYKDSNSEYESEIKKNLTNTIKVFYGKHENAAFVYRNWINNNRNLFVPKNFYLVEKIYDNSKKYLYLNALNDNGSTNIKSSDYFYSDENVEIIPITDEMLRLAESELVRDLYSNSRKDLAFELYLLQQMYENGGIYCGSELIIDEKIDLLFGEEVFFSLKNNSDIYTNFFGSRKENNVIKELISTYQSSNSIDNYKNFAERTANVLRVLFDIPLHPTKKRYGDIRILSSLDSFLPCITNTKSHYSHDICFDKDSNEFIKEMLNSLEIVYQRKIDEYQEKQKDKLTELEKENINLKNALNNYLGSTIWKSTAWLRFIMDKIKKITRKKGL